ncbi:MAG: ATP-binding protein [Xanthomonadales bacterium]|nr:ATP-binding protein [Xanthomonadales bacterium]
MKLKLIHKLLIAMFVCTTVVLVLITLVTRASIGRGFMDFLQNQERNRLELLVPELATWYAEHGSWEELVDDPRQFYYLMFLAIPQEAETRLAPGPGRGQREGRRGQGFPGAGPPAGRGPAGEQRLGNGPGGGPGGRIAFGQRVFLLDAAKAPVIGEVPADFDENYLLPVEADGQVAGWLGIALIRNFSLPEEEAFISRLRDNLLLGLGIGLAVAALLAWLLARHLSRPIKAVAEGIRSVAGGDFATRLETGGSDEIARLSEDVNRLSAALGEHEAVRKRVMSDIAHELRTPLAIISGELEAMSDGIRPLDKTQLNSVHDEVRHLAVLVDDLHNLAMTDAGALAYKMAPVNFNDLVQLAIDSFAGPANEKNLDIEYTGTDRTISLHGDEKRLRQLLHNLLDNSVRYTDAGGRISVALSTRGQLARLLISDSAPGASVEECEHMFERLYRMEASRNRNSGGSGLGLAICRNIVEAHGGQIDAQPGPDGGLLITTTLPLDS